MKENKLKSTISKYLIVSILFIIGVIFYFELMMILKAEYYQEFYYKPNHKFLRYFEQYYFTFSLSALLILVMYTKFGFFRVFKKIELESIFAIGFVLDIAIGLIVVSNFYNSMDFYEKNLWLYRTTYLLIILPFLFLIYEIIVNKGKNIFPNLKYFNTKERNNSEEKELNKLKELGIIDEDKYSIELNKIEKEKILIDIKNTNEYKEFYNSLNVAFSKSFITKEIMQQKLSEKEKELLEVVLTEKKVHPIENNGFDILTEKNKFISRIILLFLALSITLTIAILMVPFFEEVF